MSDEIENVLSELKQAEQNFNYADPDYIDAAIYEMNAVNEKFSNLLREIKNGDR